MLIDRVKKIYIKYFLKVHTWVTEIGIPNYNNLPKLLRSAKWTFLPRYRAYPPFVIIDPVVNCNLKCPLCSIPPRLLPNYGAILGLEDFKRMFENIRDVTNTVFFCHAGEPFLNKKLFDMIRIVNDANMISSVVTNGTLLNKANIDRIFDSGLDNLQISFDGFSPGTFEKYRVGANFTKTLAGITQLAIEKKKRKKTKPFISITFLINAYNCHEVDRAKKYFEGIGIRFSPKGINLNLHRRKDGKKVTDLAHWIDTKSPYSMYRLDSDNQLVFKEPFKPICDTCLKPVITCKGEILLCCHDIFNSVKLGHISGNFKTFWFSEEYKKIRDQASKRKLPLCKVCGK